MRPTALRPFFASFLLLPFAAFAQFDDDPWQSAALPPEAFSFQGDAAFPETFAVDPWLYGFPQTPVTLGGFDSALSPYGSWLFSAAYGWGCSPGYTWAPSWADWRYSAGYVSWAPRPSPGFRLAFNPFSAGWARPSYGRYSRRHR